MPNFVILFGPPAAGKARVGHELAQRAGYRFFHNHLTADPVAALFGYGTPQFGRLTDAVRDLLLAEAAKDPAIPGIVFTFVWALDLEEDCAFVERTARRFTESGWGVCFVELQASLQARIAREGSPFRTSLKPALRDVEAARARQRTMDARYRMHTVEGELHSWPLLRIDTEQLAPEAAAQKIQQHFRL